MNRARLETFVLKSLIEFHSLYPSGLKPANFSRRDHQKIFVALGEFSRLGEVSIEGLAAHLEIDPAILHAHFQDCSVISQTDGARWINALWKKAKFEEISAAVSAAVEEAASADDPVEAFVAAQHAILAEERSPRLHGLVSSFEIIQRGLEDQKTYLRRGKLPAHSTGLVELDAMIGGFRPGELIILAAEPGAGKTTLATWIGENFAFDGKEVLVLSGEMTDDQMAERGAKSKLKIAMQMDPTLGEIQKAEEALQRDQEALRRIHWGFRPRYSLGQALVAARSVDNLQLLVFDHLRKWDPKSQGFGRSSTYDVTTRAVGEIKDMAKLLNVPVLCLAHLSRKREEAERPSMGLIRDAGTIEDDADTVMMLWPQRDERGKRNLSTSLWVLKSRQTGVTGSMDLYYDHATQGFRTLL